MTPVAVPAGELRPTRGAELCSQCEIVVCFCVSFERVLFTWITATARLSSFHTPVETSASPWIPADNDLPELYYIYQRQIVKIPGPLILNELLCYLKSAISTPSARTRSLSLSISALSGVLNSGWSYGIPSASYLIIPYLW